MSANPIVNYLGLVAGTPPTPPPGVIYTYLDVDGATPKYIDSTGTTHTFGGGAVNLAALKTAYAAMASIPGLNYSAADGTQSAATAAQVAAASAAATTTLQGAMTANDKNFVEASLKWWRDGVVALSALIPQLTDFEYMKVSQLPLGQAGTTYTNDGAVEGGGKSTANATFTSFGGSVFQTPKTGRWAFRFRVKLAGPTNAKDNEFGFINAAGNSGLALQSKFATDATHLVLALFDAGTTSAVGTFVGDGAWHDIDVTFDLTTVRFYVDGTLAGSTATLTNLVDGARFFYIYNTTAGDTIVGKILYGYVAP